MSNQQKRVFYAEEKGQIDGGIWRPSGKQWRPKDFNPATDTIIRVRGGRTTGRGSGRVRVPPNIPVHQRARKVITPLIKKEVNREQQRAKMIQARIDEQRRKIIFAQQQEQSLAGDVQPVDKPSNFFSRKFEELKDLQRRQQTQSIRTQQKDIKNELALLGTTASVQVGEGALAILRLPQTTYNLIKNPQELKNLPADIRKNIRENVELAQISPTEFVGKIAGEFFLLKGTGETFKIVGKLGERARARINPKFKKFEGGKITGLVTTTSRGGKKITTLKIGGSVKKLGEPISKQVKLAGKDVVAVSSQADALVGLVKRKKIIRKPIPNEAKLGKKTRALLRKFDLGTINADELILLQRKIPLLERSFFADPRGRFRPSRLGVQKPKDAKLVDILSGDFTIRKNRPQILVFDIKVSKFPKSLADVRKALASGKQLTPSQSRRLLDWQLKKTGRAKPIGFLSREPEITLAPGEIIKRKKTIGVTIINGRRVPIVQATIGKPTKATQKLLMKRRRGKLTKREVATLKRRLQKESGFKLGSSSQVSSRPRARVPKVTPRLRATSRKAKTPKRGGSKTSTKRKKLLRTAPIKRRTTIPKRIKRSIPITRRGGRVSRPTGGSSTGRRKRVPKKPLTPTSTIVPRKKLENRMRATRITKTSKGYNIFGRPKQGRKLIKVNMVPVTKTQAVRLRNFILDTSLARTGSIKATKLKARAPRIRVPKKNLSAKFRSYRLRSGRRIPLRRGKVIERRKNLLDTRQEKKKITLARRVKQLQSKAKKKPAKRKKSASSIRATRLKNLAKARRVLARKRKK